MSIELNNLMVRTADETSRVQGESQPLLPSLVFLVMIIVRCVPEGLLRRRG
eukprot:COSAG01_NODE_2708_length_7219_cov_2.933146_4_plen_51_part_00